MTIDKAAKRAVRERMAKTGERYTAARRHLLPKNDGDAAVTPPTAMADPDDAGASAPPTASETASPVAEKTEPAIVASALAPLGAPPSTPGALPPRVAEPDMGDAAIARGTGRTWDEWFALLDAWGAAERTHPEIARHVSEAYGVDGWWAQGVTVGYERARGLRARHQRPDGFSANVSKTFPVAAGVLHAALVDEAARDRWLESGTLRLRTQQPGRSARFDVLADGARLQAYLTAKGPGKTALQLQIERLPDAAAVSDNRARWRARLDRLAAALPLLVASSEADEPGIPGT